MKRITKEEMEKYLPIIRQIVEKRPADLGPMLDLKRIIRWADDGTMNVDLFNSIILRIPLSDIVAYREYGLDFPRHDYNEVLED